MNLKYFLQIAFFLSLIVVGCVGSPEKQTSTYTTEKKQSESSIDLSKDIKEEDSLSKPTQEITEEWDSKIDKEAKISEQSNTLAVKKVVKKPVVRKRPEITFEHTSFEFGEINEGDKITHNFKFQNTGNGPLSINDVVVSCGCTVPSYPIMPIGPSEFGTIGVVYDSKGKFGSQRPFITVKSNAPEKLTKLFLIGSIKHVFEKTTPKDTLKVSEKSNS